MADLLTLALRACHDHTAQPVLGDAVQEADWYDESVMRMVVGDRWATNWRKMTQARLEGRFRRRAAKPDRRWCRAVAGVLLFGSWTADRWPGVLSSWRKPATVTDAMRILRELWPQDGIGESVYGGLNAWLPAHSGEGPFFGINRTADPLRLAGQQVDSSDDVKARIIEAARMLHAQDGRAVVTSIDRGTYQVTFDRPAWSLGMVVPEKKGTRRLGGLPAPSALRVYKFRG